MTAKHRNATPGSQVATCQHPTCYLPAYLGNSGICVLHDPDPGKDAASFEQAREEKIKGEEEDDSVNQVDLSGVVFPTEANFRGRVFTKAISFARARFMKGATFHDTEFTGVAYFLLATFAGEANFQGAEFDEAATFWDAKFARKPSSVTEHSLMKQPSARASSSIMSPSEGALSF